MKKTIRDALFETNSSSVHTLVYKNQTLAKPELPINPETNKVIGHFGQFGIGDIYYETQEMKLSYLLTVLYYIHHHNTEDVYDSWDFEELEKVVNKHCGTDGIEIKEGIEPYIDHQSVPEYGDCKLFSLTKENMENFIFNPDVMLHTDCD